MSPCEIIEAISPAGLKAVFGKYLLRGETFRSLRRSTGRIVSIWDFESVPGLCERFGLTFPKI